MIEINLKYGSGEIDLRLPEGAQELRHSEPKKVVDPRSFRIMLKDRIQKNNPDFSNVGIIVSDKTRLCEYPTYLPLLASVLEESGLSKDQITFYIAYGTHPGQTEAECLNSYGDTYKHYNFVPHDSRDDSKLVSLGTTGRGTQVKVFKKVLEHDLLITFGALSHHYFAGFGGGRKLLFPGMAAYDSILHNHQLFLDYDRRDLSEGCQSGNLDENPLARDLEEISSLMPGRLEIHGILNSKKEVCEIHVGTTYDEFRQACLRYDHFYRSSELEQYDLVVASAGGYPKDINFIQAHKSIHNSAAFVRDGGTLVIFAEGRDGIGNQAFLSLFRLGGWDAIFDQMQKKYENNAGTAISMIKKSRRIRIRYVTSFDNETCELLGAIKTNIDEAKHLVSNEKGSVAWIENASLLYK